MIIAGPGTGKTRTLTHRIAAQIAERGLPPQACLALTFTRRAAQEMRERLSVLIPRQADRLTVTTFHGLGLTILREYGSRSGLAPGFEVADERARLAVAAQVAGSDRAAGTCSRARRPTRNCAPSSARHWPHAIWSTTTACLTCRWRCCATSRRWPRRCASAGR